MKAFAELVAELEETAEREDKVAVLARYLRAASPADAAWAVRLLSGHGPPRTLTPRRLRRWAGEAAGVPDWLFAACRQAVSDLAETAALLLAAANDAGATDDRPLHEWIEGRLLPIARLPPAERRRRVLETWSGLDERQLLVSIQLLAASFRPPVTRQQLACALAEVGGGQPAALARRLAASLEPTAEAYRWLLAPEAAGVSAADRQARETMTLDTVLIYAQRGRGRRAAFYCDLTFGLWHEGTLVPFARTDRGLGEDELGRVDAWVRRHVVERFGPVRAVEPRQVFTLAFDGVEPAPRRKSGLAARAARVARWRAGLEPEAADDLAAARALLGDAE